jgi:rRNA maturation endonuclease Nob1
MSMEERIENIELIYKECLNCLTIYPVPVIVGCSICPTCGQRSCSE